MLYCCGAYVAKVIILFKKRSRPRVFLRKPHRRAIYYSGPPQDSSPFYQKVKRLALKGGPPVHGRRHQCRSPKCKSPSSNVYGALCMPVVAQCVERLQHFNRAAVQNFNVAGFFLPGACGSLRPPSVASPPRCRPLRLSPLVVQVIISMSVSVILHLTSRSANRCPCLSLYDVLVLLSLVV